MFNKNDPLIGSVKQVMAENQVRRDVEKQLNEELGIHSKKALPFEHHAEYDALLEQRIAEARTKETSDKLDSVMSKYREAKKSGDKDSAKSAIEDAAKIHPGSRNIRQQLGRLKIKKEEVELEEVDTGEYDARKSTPSSKDKNDEVFARHRERVKKLKTPSWEKEGSWSKKMKAQEKAARKSGDIKEEGSHPRNAKEAELAKHHGDPKKITQGDVLKARGVVEQEQLEEKAVSKAQQRFFGLVRGIQKGEAKGSDKAEKAAKEMSTKEVKKYAKTKQKGLPEKVDEDFDLDAVMEEIRANIGEEAFAALMAEADQPSPAQQGARNPRQALDISVGRTQTTGPQAGVVPSPVSRENDMPANKAGEDSAFSPPNIAAQRQQAPVRPGTTPTMSARSEIAASKEAGVPDTRTDIRAPITAPKGEGAVGKALASTGVSRAERRSQEFVDKELGAGKFKAGSAEANIALQKKFQSQRDTAMAREKASTYTAPTPPPRPAGLRESLETTIKKVLKG